MLAKMQLQAGNCIQLSSAMVNVQMYLPERPFTWSEYFLSEDSTSTRSSSPSTTLPVLVENANLSKSWLQSQNLTMSPSE